MNARLLLMVYSKPSFLLFVKKKAFALASTSFVSQVLALAEIETEVKYIGGVEQIPFKGSFKFKKYGKE